MKRKIFVFIFLIQFCGLTALTACDACGCSTSNLGIGLLTDFKSNFLRLSYFHSSFYSYPQYEQRIVDEFNLIDLSLRYAIHPKVRLMAHLPMGTNYRRDSKALKPLNETGIGDFRVQTNYVFVNQPLSDSYSLYLEAGAGISLPTGEFDSKIHERDLPDNFNVGRGALGFIFQANTVLTTNGIGVVGNVNYQINGKTKDDYHFGNQVNLNLNTFYEIGFTNYSLIPNIGIGYESSEKNSYSNLNKVHGTGGRGSFVSAAFNFKSKSWLAGVAYSAPITQDYSDGEVTAKGRISCQFSYIF